MKMKEEQIRNVAKVFEAFARAIAKRENIKIEYLNDEGVIENLTIEICVLIQILPIPRIVTGKQIGRAHV